MGRAVRATSIAASLMFMLACSAAMAENRRTELVSVGPGGANVSSVSIYDPDVSADGTKAFFGSADAITPDDGDGLCNRNYGQPYPPPPSPCHDLYERDLTNHTTKLVSTGPEGATGNFDANFAGMTDDGSHVYFETAEKLVPEDTDSGCSYFGNAVPCTDVYERVGDTTRLVSQGPNDSGQYDADFRAVSADGSRVFFTTREPLIPEDTNGTSDTYVRVGNETRFIGAFGFESQGGTKIVFTTTESVLPDDTDTCLTPNPSPCPDIYLRDLTTGSVQLVSTGPHGNQDRYSVSLLRATPDLGRIFFTTAEPLVDEDVEANCPYHDGWGEVSCVDIYEWSDGTTKLISTGPKKTGNDGTVPKATNDWATLDYISPDGQRVYFHTREQLVDADVDSVNDVYLREGGVTTLLSDPPGDAESLFSDVSDDGSRTFLTTADPWSPSDTDSTYDVYERFGGSLERITFGPAGGNGPDYTSTVAASSEGARFFFYTAEKLTTDDTNPGQDIYERFGGQTTLISKGPTGAGAGFAYSERRFRLEDEGRHFYFAASGRLVPEDTDDNYDLYVSIVNDGPSCDNVRAYRSILLPANRHWRTVVLRGASDPDGDSVTLEVTGVTQDEPVDGRPDARLTRPAHAVRLRAERDPDGDGRVYRVAFRAADGNGGECEGVAKVSVPRQKYRPAVDSAPPSYDSLAP